MTRGSARWVAVALGAAAACGIGWVAAPSQEPSASVVSPRSDRWIPPNVPRSADLLKQATQTGVAPYWGPGAEVSKAPAAAAPPPPSWWVAGVYGPESARRALVLFGDRNVSPLRLGVGDRLPSGHTVVSVGQAGVCIRIGDSNYTLGVERRER
jgi:hypothetical protein